MPPFLDISKVETTPKFSPRLMDDYKSEAARRNSPKTYFGGINNVIPVIGGNVKDIVCIFRYSSVWRICPSHAGNGAIRLPKLVECRENLRLIQSYQYIVIRFYIRPGTSLRGVIIAYTLTAGSYMYCTAVGRQKYQNVNCYSLYQLPHGSRHYHK